MLFVVQAVAMATSTAGAEENTVQQKLATAAPSVEQTPQFFITVAENR